MKKINNLVITIVFNIKIYQFKNTLKSKNFKLIIYTKLITKE